MLKIYFSNKVPEGLHGTRTLKPKQIHYSSVPTAWDALLHYILLYSIISRYFSSLLSPQVAIHQLVISKVAVHSSSSLHQCYLWLISRSAYLFEKWPKVFWWGENFLKCFKEHILRKINTVKEKWKLCCRTECQTDTLQRSAKSNIVMIWFVKWRENVQCPPVASAVVFPWDTYILTQMIFLIQKII